MYLFESEKTAIFIDGPNLFSSAKALDFDIDYKKFLDFFQMNCHLIRTSYYTAYAENQEFSPLRPLTDWLSYNGFNVFSKPMREFIDHHGHARVKSSIPIDITVDMLEISPFIDHIILFSGDPHLTRTIRAVQSKAVRVTVVSTNMPQPSLISDDLRRQADYFVDLITLKKHIARLQRGQKELNLEEEAEINPSFDTVTLDGSNLDWDEYDDEDDL